MNNKETVQFLGSTYKGKGSYFLLAKVIRSFVVPVISLYNLCLDTAFCTRNRPKQSLPTSLSTGHHSINSETFQHHLNLETPLWCTVENVL